jgi:hypothetical protein
VSKHAIRAAIEHRDHVIAELRQLTDVLLHELEHKGRHVATADGFPSSTLGDGMARSSSALTSVERAAEARTYHSPEPDNVGDAIRDVFNTLSAMADTATRMSRKVAFVKHVATKAEGRISSLQGECQACQRSVSGAESDRLRAGYCDACRKAWERAGRPDRVGWERERRQDIAERQAS